jgi:hypothetical protein
LKGHWLGNVLLTGENTGLMARKKGVQGYDWGTEGGCDCEKEKDGFLEGFHLDCFPL